MENTKTRIKSNSINLMINLNKNLTTISYNPEYGVHLEDVDEELTRIKCDVALSNQGLSVMINGKETDSIDNRIFDKCFIKSKIKDIFYKV